MHEQYQRGFIAGVMVTTAIAIICFLIN